MSNVSTGGYPFLTQVTRTYTLICIFQDGQVTLDALIKFQYDFRKGKHAVQSKRSKACIAAVGSALEWWRSMKSQTLRAVIITHFQLMSSLKVSFPEMGVRDAADEIFSNGTVSIFKEALNDATGTVSSLNVAVLEYIGCFVGPRHESRLIYTTVTAIGLLLAAGLIPWAFRRATSGKRIAQHDSNFIAAVEHYCLEGQLILIFLVYPALTTTIMRTFVCQEYAQDDQGNPTKWLVDDTVVQCDFSMGGAVAAATAAVAGETSSNTTAKMTAAVVGATPYVLLYAYSWAMVIIVVLGFPTIVYIRLWSWRHPFDRMYFIDEDGREKPTPEALTHLYTIVMFRSGVWAMSIVDMFFKFLLVSFIGVLFQSHQIAGLCVAGLCCAPIIAFFALKRPYLYTGGNYLSVASYFALLAAYIGALTEKLEYDKYDGWRQTQEEFGNFQLTAHFKNLLFITWLLPYIIAFADLVNAPKCSMRVVAHCRRRGGLCKLRGKDGRRAGVHKSKRDESGLHHATAAAFRSDHKRGVHILSIFQSLLPIVGKVVHAAGVYAKHVRAIQKQHKQHKTAQQNKRNTKQTFGFRRRPAWDENNDTEATLAIAKELDVLLHSMIKAFSNGGSGEQGDNGDVMEGKVRGVTLIGNYQPLYWRHFIDVETAARKLSKAAFPRTDVCHLRAQSGETGKPGCVRKSFVKRHLLWSNPITEQLQRIQEESRRTSATSSNEAEAADASSSKEHAHPSMRDIATW